MSKIILVEQLVSFRIRYAIELADDAPKEWAEETVIDGETSDVSDFSAVHIGDQVISSRQITEEEYLKLFDEDNDYLYELTDERKKEFIYKENNG